MWAMLWNLHFALSAMGSLEIWSRNWILERWFYQKLPKKPPTRLRPKDICITETSLSHQSILPSSPLLQNAQLPDALPDQEHQISALSIAVLIKPQSNGYTISPLRNSISCLHASLLLLLSPLLVRISFDFGPGFNTLPCPIVCTNSFLIFYTPLIKRCMFCILITLYSIDKST